MGETLIASAQGKPEETLLPKGAGTRAGVGEETKFLANFGFPGQSICQQEPFRCRTRGLGGERLLRLGLFTFCVVVATISGDAEDPHSTSQGKKPVFFYRKGKSWLPSFLKTGQARLPLSLHFFRAFNLF